MSEFFFGGWKRNFLRMALMIGCAGWAVSARANVYATDLKLNGGTTNLTAQPGEAITIDYVLNEAASSGVIISIKSGPTVVRAITLSAGASGSLRGANTVLWDGLDNTSNSVAGGTYSISITARSTGYTNWTQLTSDDDPNTYVFSGRGITVDRNAGSVYFGRVFVANSSTGLSPLTTPGDVLGILKFNADGSKPPEGIVSTGDYNWPDSSDFGLNKLEVSAADQVYVADLRNGGELLSWDPAFSTNSFVQVLQPANIPFGARLSGLALVAQGTNTLLWMSDALSTSGILRWTLGTNGASDPADPGLTVVGIAPATTGLTVAPADVALDGAGNIYACQPITVAGDLTPRVFKFAAYDPSTNGGAPELTATWAVGAGDDTCGGASGLAVDPTGAYVAVSFKGSTSGLPGNTKVFSTATGALVTNIDLGLVVGGIGDHQDTDCAWDAAGNLYYLDDFWGRWRTVSPPGANQFTTVAPAVVEVAGSQGTPPQIIDIGVTNGTVTITFSASAGDTPGMFVVKSSPALGGQFAAVQNASISLVSAVLFKAVFAASGSIQFYTVDRQGSFPPTAPQITGMAVAGGSVAITFTGSSTDVPGAFKLQSAPAPGAAFSEVTTATITQISAGVFKATAPASGPIQFYRIQR